MKTTTETKKWKSLEEILETTWEMLTRGASVAKDPFHTPVLGTVGPDNCNLRTVVLRRVIPDERLLMCHSDLRSGKMRDIQQNSRVSWLFYHPEQKVQLRLVGQATIHTTDRMADQQWAATKLMSRRCYCAPFGPGTLSDKPSTGLPDFLQNRSPAFAESELGRKNFAVISCRSDFLDWLFLRARGHCRAQFSWKDNIVASKWVTP
jgi:3-hydroxyisobutyrate dehydrogenase